MSLITGCYIFNIFLVVYENTSLSYLFRLYKKTNTATGIVKSRPNSNSTMIARLIAIARRTKGKKSNDRRSLLSLRDAKTFRGETSPDELLDFVNHDRKPV